MRMAAGSTAELEAILVFVGWGDRDNRHIREWRRLEAYFDEMVLESQILGYQWRALCCATLR